MCLPVRFHSLVSSRGGASCFSLHRQSWDPWLSHLNAWVKGYVRVLWIPGHWVALSSLGILSTYQEGLPPGGAFTAHSAYLRMACPDLACQCQDTPCLPRKPKSSVVFEVKPQLVSTIFGYTHTEL